MTYTEIIC